MRETKPAAELVAEMRAAAHADLDRILDALPLIVDEARAPYKTTLERVGGNAQGDHSDPTGEAGIKPATRAHDWIKRTRHTLLQLQHQSAAVDKIIGPADVCVRCRDDITKTDKTTTTGIVITHDRCRPYGSPSEYRRHRLARLPQVHEKT